MRIIGARQEDIPGWLALRQQLWPDMDEIHLPEMQAILAAETAAAFLMLDGDGRPVGFIGGALYLDGPKNYGYVEGWFVEPAHRNTGLGGQLLGALEEWILHHSIDLVLSDTIPEEYPLSTRAHHRHGYETLKELTVFIKKIRPEKKSGADQA